MQKRGNGEGTYRTRKDKSIEFRIRYQGKRYSVYGIDKKECKSKWKQLKNELDFGISDKSKNMTYETFLNEWLDNIVLIKNRPSTYDNYKSIVDNHIIPYLGKMKITDINQNMIQALIKKEVSKKKSSNTISLIHHVCRVSMNFALEKKMIMVNPALGIVKPKKEKREMKVLTTDQFDKLRDLGDMIREKERMFSCFIFMFYTGLRRGEILGLKWTDIDFKGRKLTMHRSIYKSTIKGVESNQGKTDSARRDVPISDKAMEELLIFKKTQDQEKIFYGKDYQDKKWIFCRPDGKRYYPTSLRKILLRILALAGIPAIRIHDTRHTFATLLLISGVNPKTVQELMGHANISTTLGYSHITEELKKQAIDKLDKI